jgi:hypothetical protein
VNASQESLFTLGTSLTDASLQQRIDAVQVLIDTTPTDLETRVELLLLALNPRTWGAEQ